jgi:hypothetical protein
MKRLNSILNIAEKELENLINLENYLNGDKR